MFWLKFWLKFWQERRINLKRGVGPIVKASALRAGPIVKASALRAGPIVKASVLPIVLKRLVHSLLFI